MSDWATSDFTFTEGEVDAEVRRRSLPRRDAVYEHLRHLSALANRLTGARRGDVLLELADLHYDKLDDITAARDTMRRAMSKLTPKAAEMVGDDGMIKVDCAFCSTSFPIDPREVE